MDTAFRQVFADYGLNVGMITHVWKLGAMHLLRLSYMPEISIQSLGFRNDLDGGRSSMVVQKSYMGVNPTACIHAAKHPKHDMVLSTRRRVDPHESVCNMVFVDLVRHKNTITASLPNIDTKDLSA